MHPLVPFRQVSVDEARCELIRRARAKGPLQKRAADLSHGVFLVRGGELQLELVTDFTPQIQELLVGLGCARLPKCSVGNFIPLLTPTWGVRNKCSEEVEENVLSHVEG